MTDRSPAILEAALPILERALDEGLESPDIHTELLNAGIIVSAGSVRRWIAGVRRGQYRVVPENWRTAKRVKEPMTFLEATEGHEQRLINVVRSWCERAGRTRGIIMPDLHLPDVDPAALRLHIEVSKRWLAGADDDEATFIHFAGDLFDFKDFGRWTNLPAILSEKQSYEPLSVVIASLHQTMDALDEVGARHKIFTTGNHDIRLAKFIWEQAGDMADWTLRNFVKELEAHEIIWPGLEQDRLMLTPTFKVLHGQYVSVNPGQSIMREMKQDGYAFHAAQGHVHRVNTSLKRLATGEQRIGFEVGCGCNLQPSWASKTMDWQQGLLLVDFSPRDTRLVYRNLLYERVQEGSRTMLMTELDGETIAVPVESSQVELEKKRRGWYFPAPVS